MVRARAVQTTTALPPTTTSSTTTPSARWPCATTRCRRASAQRAILRQAAKLEADVDQRKRTGFRVGAQHRRAAQAVEEREEELVSS